MSLARGMDSFHDGPDEAYPPARAPDLPLVRLRHRPAGTPSVGTPSVAEGRAGAGDRPVVIAIASTAEERLRLAALVGDHAPVLLVGSWEEARALVHDGSPAPPPEQPPEPPTEQATRDPRTRGPDPEEGSREGAPRARVSAVVAPADVSAAGSAHHRPDHPDLGAPVLVVDSDLREARWLDRRVPLSRLEHDVLVHLVRQQGSTLTFERLHVAVWGSDHLGGGGDVQSVVKRLRRKLHELGSSLRILPVRGIGLRLVDSATGPGGGAGAGAGADTPTR